MLFEGDYYSPSELFSCLNDGTSSMMMTMKNKKMINKRRFSDEQVKSLESIFENETKLEPKKKVQLARELGLEPRQVAIWFQNKRARYKSRQLERDYNILQSNYDSLTSHFDALKKEKQSLLSQLQKLKELVEKDEKNKKKKKNNKEEEESSNKSSESQSEKRQHDQQEWEEVQNKPTNSVSLEGSEYGTSSIMSSDEGSSAGNGNAHYLVNGTGEMDMEILAAMVSEPVVTECKSVTVPSESGWDDGLRPDEGLFDSDTCGQWWDFWS